MRFTLLLSKLTVSSADSPSSSWIWHEINLSAVEPFTEELAESEIKLSLSRLFYDLKWVSDDLIDATKKILVIQLGGCRQEIS